MVPNQLGVTRLAYEVHQERVQPATAHRGYDDESYLRPERPETPPRLVPRSVLAHLLRFARVRETAGHVS